MSLSFPSTKMLSTGFFPVFQCPPLPSYSQAVTNELPPHLRMTLKLSYVPFWYHQYVCSLLPASACNKTTELAFLQRFYTLSFPILSQPISLPFKPRRPLVPSRLGVRLFRTSLFQVLVFWRVMMELRVEAVPRNNTRMYARACNAQFVDSA